MVNLQYHCKVLTQKLKPTNCLAKLKDLEEEKRKNSKNMNLIHNIIQNADEKAICRLTSFNRRFVIILFFIILFTVFYSYKYFV
jgi:hypothetical protein